MTPSFLAEEEGESVIELREIDIEMSVDGEEEEGI